MEMIVGNVEEWEFPSLLSFLFRLHDHKLFALWLLILLWSEMGGNGYENENRFSDRVGNDDEICIPAHL